MVLVVADTSALVSIGAVASVDRSPLPVLLDEHRLHLPERVVSELRETASYDDASADAAQAVLARRPDIDVHADELDEEFPLDDGENAAVTLANDLGATQFLCDEFNQLALVHASLADARLVTTPTFLIALVRNGCFDGDQARSLLSTMSEARSWEANSYVERAKRTLERETP